MSSLLIRNMKEETKQRLRVQAALHGRSMQDEAVKIIERSLFEKDIGTAIHELFAPMGGLELEIPPRDQYVRAEDSPDFSGPEYDWEKL